MAKTRKNRQGIFKNIKKTTENTLPIVNKGLTKVGTVAKKVVSSSVPLVKKSVSSVYNTLASGFDLGIKGVKQITTKVSNITQSKRKYKGKKSQKRKSQKRKH
jgi:hypothetical protein